MPALPTPDEFILVEGVAVSGFEAGHVLRGVEPGRFWVTPERLVWRPWRQEPEQLTLAALTEGSVTRTFMGLGMTVEGARRSTLLTGPVASHLVRLMDLCRQLPGGPPRDVREEDLVVLQARGHAASFPTELTGGLALFRSGFVAFLPTRRLMPLDHLRRWVGRELPLASSPELLWNEALIERLRRLPEAAFGKALRELVRVRGGWLWPTREVRRAPDQDGSLQFEHDGQVLRVPASARREALQAFLEQHLPGASRPGLERPARTGWKRYLGNPIVFALGVATYTMLLKAVTEELPSSLDWVLSVLGQAALGWAFMRYMKSRGYHPLLGPVLALLCPLGAALLALVIPDKNPGSPGHGK